MRDLLTLMRTRRTREPWERNLVVIWIAQFIAMIGMSACIPFLPLYVRELGVAAEDAAMWSGIIAAAPFVLSSLLTPVWGVLGDRYGQKTMVMRAILGLGIAMTLMGFAPNIWWLLGLRIFQGAASGFIAASNAFVSTQTPIEKTGVALGTIQTSISAGNIIGPLIGGVISDVVGFRAVFFFVGIMCLSSLYIIWKHLTEQKQAERRAVTRVRGNIALVLQSPQLRVLLVMILLSQIALVLPSPIFPYYLEELGAPQALLSTLSGIVVSIVGVTTIISAPWWGKRGDYRGFGPTILVAGSIICAGMLIQSIIPSYGWLIPLRACIGLASGAMLPMMYSELTKNAPTGSTGGIMGLASSAALIGNLLGPLACSMIASSIELEWIFVTSSAIMASVVWSSRTVTWSRPLTQRQSSSRFSSMRTFATLLCFVACSAALYALPTGYSGRTSTTSFGCGGCHGGSASNRTTVTLEASKMKLAPGEVGTFTVVVAHATYPGAGVGVAVRTSETGATNAGTLAVSTGTGLRVGNGEITHTSPRQLTGGSVRFTFTWTAPTTPGTYYIQAIGNAVNGNGRDDGNDNWAFMQPQAVTVEPSTSVDEEATLPLAVFPNPLRGDASLYLGADISGMMRVQLISTAGSVVVDEDMNVERGQLPRSLAMLPRGVYAIITSNGTLVRRGRVVIE